MRVAVITGLLVATLTGAPALAQGSRVTDAPAPQVMESPAKMLNDAKQALGRKTMKFTPRSAAEKLQLAKQLGATIAAGAAPYTLSVSNFNAPYSDGSARGELAASQAQMYYGGADLVSFRQGRGYVSLFLYHNTGGRYLLDCQAGPDMPSIQVDATTWEVGKAAVSSVAPIVGGRFALVTQAVPASVKVMTLTLHWPNSAPPQNPMKEWGFSGCEITPVS